MTRIQLIEAPYLSEFISWYLQLGFNRIYFLNTEPKNEAKIKEFITQQLLQKVTFVNHTCATNNFSYLRKMFTNTVSEDYVLHADSDEYLMLPKKYSTIENLVAEYKYDIYHFRWVDVPVNQLYADSMIAYLRSNQATARYCATQKMMVRRKAWLADPNASCNPHQFICKGTKYVFQDPGANGEIPFYIHFLVRGYLHTVIKVFEQRLPTERGQTPKSVNKQFVLETLPFKKYPFRVLSACGEYCISNKNYLKIERWRIPEHDQPVQNDKALELYKGVLNRHSVQTNKNILEKDVFSLEEKFINCTKTVNQKYKAKLVGKMPSFIGNFLKKNM